MGITRDHDGDDSHQPGATRCRSTELLIGELAKRVNVSNKAVRLYESMGLLPQPRRTDSGYRIYGEEHVSRLKFVVGAKRLGLSLQEIQGVVHELERGGEPCAHVSRLLRDKLARLDQRIYELSQFRRDLAAFKEQVEGGSAVRQGSCRHIEGVLAGAWHPSISEPHDGFGEQCH